MITSAEEFVRLRTSENPDEYFKAAQEPAPEEVWLDIIQKYPDMRENVAHNKTVKGRVLEILAEDKDWRVRRQVAERRAAGEKLLIKLSTDNREIVRSQVIDNPKVTKEILIKLTKDITKNIRDQAAEKLANWKD